jgi:hypothetical protein
MRPGTAQLHLTDAADEFTSTLYPNPTQGSFKIVFSEELSEIEMVIVDVSGKTIGSKKASNSNIIEYDVSNVTPGTYIVYLTSGTTKKEFKLIKRD